MPADPRRIHYAPKMLPRAGLGAEALWWDRKSNAYRKSHFQSHQIV